MTPVQEREEALARLHALVRGINADLDLPRTLQAVCAGVVVGLGFEVAVVNLVQDGAVEVVAVEGPDDARTALLGQRGAVDEWDLWVSRCSPVGGVLVDYRRVLDGDDVPTWIPDTAPVADGDPDAWHPLDAVLAPLWSRRSGVLGYLSVDLPRDGRRPDAHQLELLTMYAAQASIAIENARLHTEVVRRDAEQAALLARLTTLVTQAPVAIVELDEAGLVRVWNPAAERIFGWTSGEVLGRPNPVVDVAEHAARLAAAADGDGTSREELRRRRKDGSELDVSLSARALRDGAGRITGYLGVYADMTDRLLLERELRHAAEHDPLTGLPNRALFRARLERAVRSRAGGALLLLDLDGFKQLNDSRGHEAGDRLLVEIGARLRGAARAGDTVARLGGDEFVVLVADAGDAEPLAERLVGLLAEPVALDGGPVGLGCSVGISFLAPGATSDAVLRQADLAMYRAKAGGRGCYEVARPARGLGAAG